MNSRGIGTYPGPPEVPTDDLTPGQHPQPSEGYRGPSIAIPIEGWQKMHDTIEKLAHHMALNSRPDFVTQTATGNTDASGNAIIQIYQAAAGMEARLHRANINALNPSTGVAYNAGTPYESAGAFVDFYEGDTNDAIGISGQFGFLPNPPLSDGPIFPGQITASFEQAPFVRGPRIMLCHVSGGPASTAVFVRYQISLKRAKGAA